MTILMRAIRENPRPITTAAPGSDKAAKNREAAHV